MSHSSGILPSEELRQSFAAASEGGSIRWFKLQIEGSEMGIAAKGDQGESAELDWEGLGGQLEDDVPCFFAFRLDAAKPAEWLLALYVPEVAKVRSKMVYASTRESLKRELGAAFIVSEMHACEKDEMTWPELKRQTQASDADRASVMTNMERMRLVDAPVDTGIKRRSYVHGPTANPPNLIHNRSKLNPQF
ncbi:hypothetical protein T484DRAFT_1837499 [Baffinella frigidus]|nr:hypothetical protein T484DRAFT_1837499 [Cryptophyta sp. CCMP2293]